MKSIIPAALVVVLVAGFIASVAALPKPAVTSPVAVEVVRQSLASPEAAAAAPLARPVAPRS